MGRRAILRVSPTAGSRCTGAFVRYAASTSSAKLRRVHIWFLFVRALWTTSAMSDRRRQFGLRKLPRGPVSARRSPVGRSSPRQSARIFGRTKAEANSSAEARSSRFAGLGLHPDRLTRHYEAVTEQQKLYRATSQSNWLFLVVRPSVAAMAVAKAKFGLE
jgi:hypothetical protein